MADDGQIVGIQGERHVSRGQSAVYPTLLRLALLNQLLNGFRVHRLCPPPTHTCMHSKEVSDEAHTYAQISTSLSLARFLSLSLNVETVPGSSTCDEHRHELKAPLAFSRAWTYGGVGVQPDQRLIDLIQDAQLLAAFALLSLLLQIVPRGSLCTATQKREA